MAGTIPIELYQAFLEAAGQQTAELGDVRYAMEELIAQLGLKEQSLQPVQAASTSSKSQTSSSSDSDSTLLKVLKSGLGVAPLVGSLIGLFGGGGEDEPAPFVKYAMPASVNIEAAERGGRISVSDYDQMGLARGYYAAAGPRLSNASSPVNVSQPAGPQSIGTQITVNVQAMDARSFLDRSGDIALAVREAMLNSNSINDVVNDL